MSIGDFSESDVLLVTGGAGFIGSNFAKVALETTPARVVILDKLTYAGSLENLKEQKTDPRFSFVEGDIADQETVRRVFAQHRPTVVLNFAAETHVDRSIDGPRAFMVTNFMGTFELLEAARSLRNELPPKEQKRFRFLHVSTDEVYGTLGPDGRFSETTPYAPNSPYSSSKAGADHIVRAYFETFGLPALITNCSNNYGPNQFPEKLIPLMILNAIDGQPLPIYGDGGNIRDWLFVEDHCLGILQVLRGGRPGEKYNIGGGNERTNIEVVDSLCELLEEMLPAKENTRLREKGIDSYTGLKSFVADRPGHDRRYAIDATKIRDELSWCPQHDLASGMRRTVRWYLDHLSWCETVQENRSARQRLGLSGVQAGGSETP